MENFKVGEYVHYNVGSDTYPAQVTWVSANGKQVRTQPVSYELKNVSPHSYLVRHSHDDCTRIWHSQSFDETTWKSRSGGPHKNGHGRSALKLYHGFSSYRDPSF